MSLSTSTRRDEILHRALARGHVDVRGLAAELGVSEATVRRDLRALSEAGHLELVYGGATLPKAADVSLASRALRNMEAKRLIGMLAGELVRDHEMLYVDGGTTCFEMRHLLKRRRGLSVIVNSWRWAVELSGVDSCSVILIGGHYRHEREDCVGPLAAQSIDQLRGYVAFISADGLDTDFGLWSNDIETAYLYQHVVRNARETVLLVDHSKFTSPSLFRICGWECVSRLVTDRDPAPQWREFLEERGVSVVSGGELYAEHAGLAQGTE
jgi:DeoR/GlpR family transcriptional regulator of sugar metabolism